MPEFLDPEIDASSQQPPDDTDLFGYDDDMFEESAFDSDDFDVEITYDLVED